MSAVRLYGRLSFTGRRFFVREYADVQNPDVLVSVFGASPAKGFDGKFDALQFDDLEDEEDDEGGENG